MKSHEYWEEVERLAIYFEEVNGEWREDYANGERYDAMHEVLSWHSYVIYYAEAIDVLRFTRNEDAYVEAFGERPQGDTFAEFAPPMAFEAFMMDVNEWIG